MSYLKKNKSVIIGLTGPSGAGKGTVSQCFEKHGLKSIDTDKVYHDLLIPPSKCYDELICHFGQEILSGSGCIDRKKLAAIVFREGNKKELEALNKITHKHILVKTLDMVEEHRNKGIIASIIDAPLLFESGFSEYCNINISVIAPYNDRLCRIMLRDNISREKATDRLKAQNEDGFYLSRSDFTIINDSDIDHVQKQVDEIVSIIFSGSF